MGVARRISARQSQRIREEQELSSSRAIPNPPLSFVTSASRQPTSYNDTVALGSPSSHSFGVVYARTVASKPVLDPMHLLITGATGFIGKHVLLDALADHRITKVTVVSRRPPSLDGKDMAQIKMAIINKLTIITRNDLGRWEYEEDKELVNALRDCKACIWCIGGKADDFATPSEFERISLTFTVNAANFFSKLAQEEQLTEGQIGLPDRRFRFCYCSAKWANRDGKANESLFSWEAHTRNMKGQVERELLSIASQSNGKMDVFVFRPGGAVAGATVKSLGGFATTVATAGLRMMPSVVIHVERIARVLVDASVGIRVEWQRQRPDGEKNTWESEEMVDWSLGLGV